MTGRERMFTAGLQVVTIIVVVGLLIYSIVESHRLAQDRADAALQTARQSQRELDGISQILDNVRRAQVDQRDAFRKLARRNEVLHGGEPGDAPRFRAIDEPSSSNPPPEARGDPQPDDGRSDQRKRDEEPPERPSPRPRPPPSPDPPAPRPTPPPSPSPAPLICLPAIDVCVGE